MALFHSFYWLSNIPLYRCTTSSTIPLPLDIYVASCCYCCIVIKSFPAVCDHQTPMSMAFSRQEYWSGSPFPSPGDLPNPGIEPMSPAWQEDSLPLSHLGNPKVASVSWLLYTELHWTLGCMHPFRSWFSPDTSSGVGFQGHIEALFLVFKKPPSSSP